MTKAATLCLTVAVACVCVSAQYGPPPTKGKKHRTTTTTTETPGAISNEISGPFPVPDTGSFAYAGSSASSSGQPGSTVATGGYWWSGPDSPFAPPPPGSQQPAGVPPRPPPPSTGACGGPAGCVGVGDEPPSKPVDIEQNPFLSSAIFGKPIPQSPQGCQGTSGGQGCQYPAGQGSGPTGHYPGQNQPGSYPEQPFPGQGTHPTQYPGTPSVPSQYPGAQNQPSIPTHPGHQPSSQGPNPYPGQQPSGSNPFSGQGPSQYPGQKPAGSSPFPGQGPSQYPGQQPSGHGQQPSGSSPFPGQGPTQYPGQQPSGPGQQPSGSSPFPGQGPSQYPGQQPSGPGQQPSGSSPFPGQGPTQYPGQQPSRPGQQPSGSSPFPGQGPSQYPGQQPSGSSPFPGQGPPQYPGQKPSGSSPYAGQGPTQYPSGSSSSPSVPLRPLCSKAGHACVPSSLCVGGVITEHGMSQMRDPQIKECIPGLEACCRLPPGGSPYSGPAPTSAPGYPTAGTQRPYTGPLNTTPFPGCAAALKCVAESYCTAEGVMSDTPVVLTREQAENRVPLTECQDPDTGIIGKCCRDPNYKDPWPAGMMMMKNPGDFDDGQYHGEGSGPGVNIGPSYNSISSTTPQTPSKDHGPKPSQGGFGKPFPPPFPGNNPQQPGLPKPPGSPYQPSQPTPGSYQPGQPSGTPYQPGQPSSPYQPGPPSSPNQPGSPYQPGQPSSPNQPGSPYQPGQPSSPTPPGSPFQPGQPSSPNQPGSPYQPGQPSSPNQPGSPHQPGQPSSPNQPGSPYQPGQPGSPQQPGQSSPNQPDSSYQPGQPTGSPYKPGFPGSLNQPQQQPGFPNQPSGTPYQPGFPSQPQPGLTKPEDTYTPGQPAPTGSYQPGSSPSQPGFQDQGPAPGSACGIRRPGPAGDTAGFGEFPWQALVVAAGNRTLLCGAAVVAENAVITAAHCVNNIRASDLLVKAGEGKLLGQNPRPSQVRPVIAIARHPGYDKGSLAKDLAILVLAQPFTFDVHVDKICIPPEIGSEYFQQPGQICVLTGWGKNALQGPVQDSEMHKIDVNVIPAKQCESKLKTSQNLGKYFILNEGFSCALPSLPSDLCKVDYGSAVACARPDGHYELAGVNSWDISCTTNQGLPSVFATSDATWINTVLSTPVPVLQADEDSYNQGLLQGESVDGVDIDDKPGFSQGYGK